MADGRGADARLGGPAQESDLDPIDTSLSQPSSILRLRDAFGEERKGAVLVASRWDESLDQLGEGEDFRIVLLREPPASPPVLRHPVVVCAPSRKTRSADAIREPSAVYQIEASGATDLPAEELEALSQGRLFSLVPLELSPDQVFSAEDGAARLAALAEEFLLQLAREPYVSAAQTVMSAPQPPSSVAGNEICREAAELRRRAEAAVTGEEPDTVHEALRRVRTVQEIESRVEQVKMLRSLYPDVVALGEDLYLLRALVEQPEAALEVAGMRRYVEEAVVPSHQTDLQLDRALALQQLGFATAVLEPQRLPSARASFQLFRDRYRKAYRDHHESYSAESASIHARLLELEQIASALVKLNTLAELGPPVGAAAVDAYHELLSETASCPHLEATEALLDDPSCPACGLVLDAEPPAERAAEVSSRIQRAVARQMARLASTAVRQVLARSGDPRVERFLKVVQASQIASLSEILDDELLGYLRRFLVEARIQASLEPLLIRLQRGEAPRREEAEKALKDLSRTLRRGFKGMHRRLAPGPPNEGQA
ncbi:MAG: hypothetical protein HYS09_02925 [Chloroflexi bacterium]|nr:hypothetical protein [Chloroflexota bacterium]